MTNQNKKKRQLVRAMAAFLTLSSFLGASSAPAFAAAYDWDVNINVTAVPPEEPGCESLPGSSDAATWAPATTLVYNSSTAVDLTVDTGRVSFSAPLGFVQGANYDGCANLLPGGVDPSGFVTADFTSYSEELTQESLDCDDSCFASDVYDSGNGVNGEVSVANATTTGEKTGLLAISWTPQD